MLAGVTPPRFAPPKVTSSGRPSVATSGGRRLATIGPPAGFTVKLTAALPPGVSRTRMRSPGTAAGSSVRWRFAARSFVDVTAAASPASPKTRDRRAGERLALDDGVDLVPTMPDAGRMLRADGAHSARASAGDREREGEDRRGSHCRVAVRTSSASRASFE